MDKVNWKNFIFFWLFFDFVNLEKKERNEKMQLNLEVVVDLVV